MSTPRYDRQSFLGADAEERIAECTVGIVGLGGGGSHLVQQLAHIGFQRYVIYDDDVVEESNLNRLVGARTIDVPATTPKLHIARMMILGLQPNALISGFACKWEQQPEPLRDCQIVFGGVDTYRGRRELEVTCRRYLMHYIDIGMDVHGTDHRFIGGQVILSSPGHLCMTCMGFLTEEKLGREAARYGNVGGRPQVIWSNGVLASTAVGIAIELVTGWTRQPRTHAFLVYDGNKATLQDSITLKNLAAGACPHFRDDDIGDPVFKPL